MVETDQSASAFELCGVELNLVRVSDEFGGHRIVLWFYPKDDTPGSTLETIEFSDLQIDRTGPGTLLIGVSRNDCFSMAFFATQTA